MTTPLRPLRCSRADCTLPANGRCAREAEYPDPLADCPELARAPAAKNDEPTPPSQKAPNEPASAATDENSQPAPWRGRHLNRAEAQSLLYRSPALLVPVLGARDAGKTCLLASFFLQLAAGQRHGLPYRFASSRSLFGFYDLIERARRWDGSPDNEIVGHSPIEEGDHIGRLLHLGLAPEDAGDYRHVDLLLTDWPGEWVTDWAELDGDLARERMPFLRRADGVVVLIDAKALLSPEGPTLDAKTAQAIRRIAEIIGPRRRGLSFVVTKMDRLVSQLSPPTADNRNDRAAWGTLGKRLRQCWAALEEAASGGVAVDRFPTSAFPGPLAQLQPVNVVQPFAHVLQAARHVARTPAIKPVGTGSWLRAMRCWGSSDGR